MSGDVDYKENLFFLAIILNVIGNFIDAIGWCVQKKAHTKRLLSSQRDQSFVKDKNWWMGFGLHAAGNGLAKLSYTLGPASVLLPLDTLRIAFTTALASKYLNEKVSAKEIIGIIIIIAAATVSTVFGPRPIEAYYTIEDIQYRYTQILFIVAAGAFSAVTLIDYILITLSNPQCSGIETLQEGNFVMLSYIWIAAFFASWNVLLVKCILEVIASSFISKDIAKMNWTHWLTYVHIIALTITMVSIEYWRQKALIKYHTGYVVAIFTVLQIVGGILLNSLFFQEFQQMDAYQLVLFFIGIMLSFVGVLVVTYDVEYHQKAKKQKTLKKLQEKENGYHDSIVMDDASSGNDENITTNHEKKQLIMINNTNQHDVTLPEHTSK